MFTIYFLVHYLFRNDDGPCVVANRNVGGRSAFFSLFLGLFANSSFGPHNLDLNDFWQSSQLKFEVRNAAAAKAPTAPCEATLQHEEEDTCVCAAPDHSDLASSILDHD